MSVLPPSGRLRWTDVPALLRTRLETALGSSVTDAVTPAGGFGHQLAAALTLTSGRRVFVKAAPDDDPLTDANVHEATVLDVLPPGAPAPGSWGSTAPPAGPPSSSPTSTDRTPTSPRPPAMPGRPGPCSTS
ncbi:hypothetical protein NKH18_00030 [Streptomyces sp. M10(2022)]